MNQTIRQHLDNLYSKDAESRYHSFQYLIDQTKEPVQWAGLAWDDLLALLHGDNHQRAIAAQLLCALAKSDPSRAMASMDKIMKGTNDERFVTARHSLQALWKVGVVNETLKNEVVERLSQRYRECTAEKNCTLVRYDILEVFRKMYDIIEDKALKETSLQLIEKEDDLKYRKKYAGLWNDILKKEAKAD